MADASDTTKLDIGPYVNDYRLIEHSDRHATFVGSPCNPSVVVRQCTDGFRVFISRGNIALCPAQPTTVMALGLVIGAPRRKIKSNGMEERRMGRKDAVTSRVETVDTHQRVVVLRSRPGRDFFATSMHTVQDLQEYLVALREAGAQLDDRVQVFPPADGKDARMEAVLKLMDRH